MSPNDFGQDSHEDDVLDEVRAALSVDPSREFAANVRARIAREPKRRWAPMIVWSLAAAAATILLGVVTQRPERETASAIAAAPVPAAAVAAARPAAHEASVAPVTRTPTARAVSVIAAASTIVPHEQPVKLDVLVPNDQRLAIDQLLRDLTAGRIDPGSLVSSGVDQLADLVPPPAIAVRLIDVPPIGGSDIKK